MTIRTIPAIFWTREIIRCVMIATRCRQAGCSLSINSTTLAPLVIVDVWGEKLEDQAAQVCKLLSTSDRKKACYELLAWRITDVFAEVSEQTRHCAMFEPEY